MSFTRAEFEAWYARERGHTVAEMRARGWVSAHCVCDVDGCPGWQAIAIPEGITDDDRRRLLSDLISTDVHRFGEEAPLRSAPSLPGA